MSLPSGYTQLAYIKSSGEQYIDTGVAAAKDLKVEAIMDVDESSSWIMILGDYTSSKYFSWWANGNLAHAYFGSKDGTLTFSAGKHTYIADGPNNKWEIDGTSITLEPASSDFSGTGGTLYLFSVHNGGSYTSASAKLYSCKIYKNGTLIRDFVPCRNASGTLGLYDLTNNRFYANAGSGDFEGPYYGPLKNSCLIDGATYQIKNGKVLIGGTKYQIMRGRTLVNGTAYEVKFDDGLTWIINKTFRVMPLSQEIDFISNGKQFKRFSIIAGSSPQIAYDGGPDGLWYAYYGSWTQEAFRTVTFSEMPTGALLTWLQANAVQQ